MTVFGLSKHCKIEELRSAYRQVAKLYHPDVALARLKDPSDETKSKVEDKFKEFGAASERLQSWIEERDKALEQSV